MVQRILVTGGSGLVGYGIQQHITKYPDCEFVFMSSKSCNLLDFKDTYNYFQEQKPDAVIHLAANVGGLFKNMSQNVEMLETNVLMNMNVLRVCHALHIQKVASCLSTCVFPDKTTYPIDETMLHNGPPHTSNEGYAYAKRVLEVHSRLYSNQYGYQYSCVIPTNIYGIQDNFHLDDAHVIPALIHKCYLAKKEQKPFVVQGNGKPLRQFVYNKDLGELLLWTLFNYKGESLILSVDEEDEISIGDVALLIAKEFDYEQQLVFSDREDKGQYKKTADNSQLRCLLPEYKFTPIQEGLRETIEWFKENYQTVRK
jgi:GDP-L-fucose synthase